MLAAVRPGYESTVADLKQDLLSDLNGRILEIGPGLGVNDPFFSDASLVVGAEPNQHLALNLPATMRGVRARAGHLPFASDSFDGVVSTLVLCSVPDPDKAVAEILRVLKPGGKFVFLEHVVAPEGTGTRRVQRVVKHPWRWVADGCHVDRPTGEIISRSGFAAVDFARLNLPFPVVGPHVAGSARKPE
jgi:SAM-dependent methyltransferase